MDTRSVRGFSEMLLVLYLLYFGNPIDLEICVADQVAVIAGEESRVVSEDFGMFSFQVVLLSFESNLFLHHWQIMIGLEIATAFIPNCLLSERFDSWEMQCQ